MSLNATLPHPYTDADRRQGQRAMILEGVFSRAMEGLTSGVVLAGFALALGANDFEIGLIAAIPFLVQLAHVPAIALLTRYPHPKRVTVLATAASRSIFLLIALLPFLTLPLRPLHALIPLLVAYATVATFAGAAWQVWVRGLVPRERLGSYFGRRMGILSFVGLATLVAAGQAIAWWSAHYPDRRAEAFGALFALGALLGYVSSALLARAPIEPSPPRTGAKLSEAIRKPFRDENYRALLVFLGAWGFAANFSLPFVTVVLLRTLGYDMGLVTALAAVSIIANVVGFRVWAPLTDKFGNKPVLGLAAAVFVATILAWALLPKQPGFAVLAGVTAVHALLGIATAGLDLAANNVVMKLAPDAEVAAYLSSASLVRAVTTGIAPLLGGLAAGLLSGHAFAMRFTWTWPGGETAVTALRFEHYDFLFLASAAMGLYAVHRLLGFKEEGEAPVEAVVRAVRRDVGQLSTVAGMRHFAHIASYAVELAYKFERVKSPRRLGQKRP